MNYGTGDGRVTLAELRRLLIKRASQKRPITYGEVAQEFGEPWHQGFGSSLKKALNELGRLNKSAKEPFLMALVVNKNTREPGLGFYREIGEENADAATRSYLLDREIERCHRWNW